MADDEDLRDDGKLRSPTFLNRIVSILITIYFIIYLLYESYHFTSRNFISAGIHEYLLFWIMCQHLIYFILALVTSSNKTGSDSSFLPTIFTGLTFPLSQVNIQINHFNSNNNFPAQLIVILWITNSMCNECIHSRDLYNILPQHMHGVTVSKLRPIIKNNNQLLAAFHAVRHCLVRIAFLLLWTVLRQSQESSVTHFTPDIPRFLFCVCNFHGSLLQWTVDLSNTASGTKTFHEVFIHALVSGSGSCMFGIFVHNNGICYSRRRQVGSCLFRKKIETSGQDRTYRRQSDSNT